MSSEEFSYDPNTWLGAPNVADPPTAHIAAPRGGARGRLALAIAGSVAILVAGIITARLSRAPHVVQPAPVATVKREPPSLARRTLLLSDRAGLEQALLAVGVTAADAHGAAVQTLAAIGTAPGQLHIVASLDATTAQSRLVRLEASFDDSSGAVATRGADGHFTVRKIAASLERVVRVVRGEMDASSFYSSAVAAGVTDTLIPQIAQALAFDFDFQREIHAGDVFEVAFDQARNAAGEAIGTPRLLFVSLTTPQKSRSLYWFKPPREKGGWFDGNGTSIISALMRTPVDGARVSSTFGMRVHPIQGFMKMHRGVDFAAPTGTTIYAAGDAVVEFAGPKGPNGNFVKLRHTNGWETLYLHLSRFAPGVVEGGHVRQGQPIGAVGTTGVSTGPHLHYEVHIADEPVNPATIRIAQNRTLQGAAHEAFVDERDRIDVNRARDSN